MRNEPTYFCWSERRGGWVKVAVATWKGAGRWNERKFTKSTFGPFIARRDY